jgi:hypothetical protein
VLRVAGVIARQPAMAHEDAHPTPAHLRLRLGDGAGIGPSAVTPAPDVSRAALRHSAVCGRSITIGVYHAERRG